MSIWNSKYQWIYDAAGRSSPDRGPAVAGTKIFSGSAITNLLRETAQNSLDAVDRTISESPVVKMKYEYLMINPDDLPDIRRISTVIDKCYEYFRKKPKVKMDDINTLKKANDKYLKNGESIPVLKISDYNTTGLNGTNFEALLKGDGLTFKSDSDDAGSFGFGKYAPYLLSRINTVLYASQTNDGEYKFQGRSLLSTFEENGRRMDGISLFGLNDGNREMVPPIKNMQDVPPLFHRTKYGTDLYIICFEKTEDWIDHMVFGALENFFYAVYKGKLEFEFRDGDKGIIVNKNTLEEQIAFYDKLYQDKYKDSNESIEFTAPRYWKVLTDSQSCEPVIEEDFRGKGEALLYIRMGEDIKGRSVLEMRSSGMKIREETNFERKPPFNGIFIATGRGKEKEGYKGNISKFLRELEGPAHDDWSINNITSKDKEEIKNEARLTLKEIRKWINETIKSKIPKNNVKAVDPYGLAKILPELEENGTVAINKKEPVSRYIPIKSTLIKMDRKKSGNHSGGSGGRPSAGGKNGSHGTPGNGGHQHGGSGTKNPGNLLAKVNLTSLSTPYLPEKNRYHISVKTDRDVKTLIIGLKISGDSSKLFDIKVKDAVCAGKHLPIRKNQIIISDVLKNSLVVCDVEFTQEGQYALEVNAYEEK